MLIFAFVAIHASIGCFVWAQDNSRTVCDVRSPADIVKQQVFGEYGVKTVRYSSKGVVDYPGCFEILKCGKLVYFDSGTYFRIGKPYRQKQSNGDIAMGSDITADGTPNLVIWEWTGGAHCCYLYHLFDIGEGFRHIQILNAGHDEGSFVNIDNEPDLEFVMQDWTYAYWLTSFLASPAPTVILKYQKGRYKEALDLMKQKPPDPDRLKIEAQGFKIMKGWAEADPPVQLWSRMLDLVYSGNMKTAWVLLDFAWPDKIPGKKQFVADFKRKIRQSPFWDRIKTLNGR